MDEKPRILVIDDERVILDSARRILTAEGFPVLTADDAETGLQILGSNPQDIVISDIMLPGISGLEFLETSRQNDPSLVVIITTGYSTVENAVDSLNKGAFDFLPKPFTFDELLSPVSRASRFLDLPLKQRMQPPSAAFAGCCFLGLQTWARPDTEGSWLLGPSELLLRSIDPIENIELPITGSELRQGARLVRMTTQDHLVHDLWSPLSGEVLEINALLHDAPDLPHQDAVAKGWLVRILPANLDKELSALAAPNNYQHFQ